MTRDLERIRFVTQRFHDLQGLRYLVPLGLLLWSGAGVAFFTASPLLLAVPFLGSFLLMLRAGQYYTSVFGEVERPRIRPAVELSPLSIFNTVGPRPQIEPMTPGVRLALILGLASAAFILFQFLFWPPWIAMRFGVIDDPSWQSQMSLSSTKAALTHLLYPLCGSCFFGIWWSRECRLSQSYHLGIGVVLSGFIILGPRFVPAAAHLWVALLLCGSAMIVAGLLDHSQLVRLWLPREEE